MDRTGDSSLGLMDSHVLVELAARGACTLGELASCLDITAATLSKRIEALNGAGLVRLQIDRGDSRRKQALLSLQGSQALSCIDTTANKLLERFSSQCSAACMTTIHSGMHRLLSGLAAPPSQIRAGEHCMRIHFRQLARALGVLGRNFLGSGLSSTHWQIVNEICSDLLPPNLTQLSECLGVEQSRLSHALKTLALKGLVKRQRDSRDSRNARFHGTKSATKLIAKSEEHVCGLLQRGLASFDLHEARRFVEALEIFVTGRVDGPLGASLDLRDQVHLERSDSGLQAARGFLVEQLVKRGCHMQLDWRLLSPTSHVYVILHQGVVAGVCEFVRSKRALELRNFLVQPDLAGTKRAANFFAICLKHAKRADARQLRINPSIDLPKLSSQEQGLE